MPVPLASGYDWRSLGGEGKITWSVIANKSGVEKQNKTNSVQSTDFSWWIFALWLQLFFEEIGKFCFDSVNSREKCWKNGKSLQTEKLRKKRKRKRKHW
jgi:hypothetical protein